MKKLLTVLLSILMIFALTACSSTSSNNNQGEETAESKDLLARIQEAGKITIATEGDWAPWTYHDESDELVGFDVEVGKKLAEKLGVEAEFVETDWDSILAGVDSGRFDIACNGVGYTEERAQKYAFSDPYVYTHNVLIVAADNEDIKTFADLAGKKNANTASSTYAAVAESYGAEIITVNNFAETVTLLQQGRADATINSEVSWNSYIEAQPDAPIKVVDVSEGDPVVIPIRKNDDAASLLTAINDALKELKASGELAEISIRYFKADNTTSD